VAETTVRRLLCFRFQCTDKSMEQVLVEDMSRNKCFFQGSNIVFYILYSFVTYTDSPSYIYIPSKFEHIQKLVWAVYVSEIAPTTTVMTGPIRES
jgi:hypothetical protein